MNELKTLF